jgi:GDP-L-fucose synthase
MKLDSKIYVAGHRGMVGSAIVRALENQGFKKLIYRTSKELDLTNQLQVQIFFENEKPEYVFLAAAKVGGIVANNKYRANFIFDNLSIQNNIIDSCYKNNVSNLIFLGSSCIYPRDCKQPIKEKYLLAGKLEKTNEPYAIAKIAGIKMCESYNFQYKTNYKCLMPCNLYGPNDNYDLKFSHFLPALVRKIYTAKLKKNKNVIVWGTGKPKRELMYVDDLADACIFFLNIKTKETLINVGSGMEKSILDYAKFILKELDYSAVINFDKSKPDGTPIKIINSNYQSLTVVSNGSNWSII